MRDHDFRAHLLALGYSDYTIKSRVSNVRRIETLYGDVDEHIADGTIDQLDAGLSYSTSDQRAGRPNPSRFAIAPQHLRTGLAVYRSTLRAYRKAMGDASLRPRELLKGAAKPTAAKNDAAVPLASAVIARVATMLRAASMDVLAREADHAAKLTRRLERTLDEIAADAMEDAPRVVVQFPCEQGRH